jgi:hypothetical protein
MGASTPQRLFLDWGEFAEIGRVLQDRTKRGKARAIPFLQFCPEMSSFLSTFSTMAWQDAPDVPPEWNPFTQRILLRSRPRSVSELGADFEGLEYAITGAMHVIHEACHVLMWEPLFVGAMAELDASTFVQMSMGFEGFCFWYPDIVVAKQLRDRYANGDVVLSRRGASSPHFSPHMAFDALGIDNADRIRQIYLDAFSGLSTPLATKVGMAHAASRSLARRIYGFYARGKLDVARLYTELNRVKLFGDFARRFWLSGLPSALPDALLARTRAGEISLDEYCDEIAGAGFRWIAGLDEARLMAVAFRRMVQTRAYFAWTVRHVLREQLFVGPSGAGVPASGVEEIVGQLDHYLARLERILLVMRDRPGHVHARDLAGAALAAADRHYDRAVRLRLKRARLWVRNRRQIFPNDSVQLPWGPLRRAEATPRRREHALQRCLEIGRGLAGERRPLPPATSEVCRRPARDADLDRWIRAHNRFMTHPEVLPRWSIMLSDVDPCRDSFRELLFVYH